MCEGWNLLVVELLFWFIFFIFVLEGFIVLSVSCGVDCILFWIKLESDVGILFLGCFGMFDWNIEFCLLFMVFVILCNCMILFKVLVIEKYLNEF